MAPPLGELDAKRTEGVSPVRRDRVPKAAAHWLPLWGNCEKSEAEGVSWL